MTHLIDTIFKSVWHFIGAAILLGMVTRFLFLLWNRFMRMLNIRSKGWPPAHCDADGDFKTEDKDEEE